MTANSPTSKGILLETTVDGSEIRQENQLRLVVYPIIYSFFFTSQVVIAGFLNHEQYHSFLPQQKNNRPLLDWVKKNLNKHLINKQKGSAFLGGLP